MGEHQFHRRFCGGCGKTVSPGSSYCGSCGRFLGESAAAESEVSKEKVDRTEEIKITEKIERQKPEKVKRVTSVLKAAVRGKTLGQSLPGNASWKVVVGEQLPQGPFPELIQRTVSGGAAKMSSQRSLRGPAISLFSATILEIIVASSTMSPQALHVILGKVLLAGTNLASGLVSKNNQDKAGRLVFFTSLIFSLLQAGILFRSLGWLLTDFQMFVYYLPNAAAQALALFTAINTARKSYR